MAHTTSLTTPTLIRPLEVLPPVWPRAPLGSRALGMTPNPGCCACSLPCRACRASAGSRALQLQDVDFASLFGDSFNYQASVSCWGCVATGRGACAPHAAAAASCLPACRSLARVHWLHHLRSVCNDADWLTDRAVRWGLDFLCGRGRRWHTRVHRRPDCADMCAAEPPFARQLSRAPQALLTRHSTHRCQ